MNQTICQAWALNVLESRKEKRMYQKHLRELKETMQQQYTALEKDIYHEGKFINDDILLDKKDKLEMLKLNFFENFGEYPQTI